MPIDFSQYISLRPFDASPTAIYLDSIDYARIVLPEFQPRQGTPEDAILQAISYISSMNISAINRLPDRLMAGIVGMMGVELDGGTKTVIDVKFTATTADGTTIPQGTVIRYDYEFLGDRNSLYFETSEELIIAGVDEVDPLPFGVVEASSFEIGQIIPLEVGYVFEIETPTTDVLQAELEEIVSSGLNEETETEYLARAVNFLSSLSSSFARAEQVDSFISSNYLSTISRSKTYDLTDSEGTKEIGEANEVGFVTIFVYGINALATSEQKTDLLAEVQARSVAGLEIGIEDVRVVEITVSANIAHTPDYESSVILQNVKSVLSTYFSPTNYRFSEGIKLSEFYAIMSSVAGVIYTTDVTVAVTSGAEGTVDVDGNIDYVYKGSLPSISINDITLTTESISL
jgi:uncharacterized phage protein gp47/JayE